MTEKNTELECQLQEKEKILENERTKCDEMIADYEKKIAVANQERETNEEEIKKLEEEKEANEEKMKKDYEEKISELKGNISKHELVYKETETKLKEDIANLELEKNQLEEEKNNKMENQQGNFEILSE